MAIIKLVQGEKVGIPCRGLNKETGGCCGAETFVPTNQTIDTSKKDSVVALACYACGARFGKPMEHRRGLGQTYGEAKYPVKDHKHELIAFAKERDREWDEWAEENGVAPSPDSVNLDELDWGEEDSEAETQAEPPANVSVDDLDWD